jgi:UDP-N-acetyl-D-mannosaminuronate dehydrogenase
MHGYNKYASLKNHYPSSVLADARYLNDWMPIHMVDLLDSALTEAKKDIKNSVICVLGYSFLENSDDARNTPTVIFLKELENRGAKYKIHDPYIKVTEEGYQIETDLDTALHGCDALVLMTKHDVYRTITPERLQNLLRTKIVIDGRNLFDPAKLTVAGFVFRGVGKGKKVRVMNYNRG